MRTLAALASASCAALALLSAPAVAGPAPAPIVIFAFDQGGDFIIRVEDRNGDGDTTDAGEVIRFFDDTVPGTGTENSQGLLALDAFTVLATDNFVPDNVVLLRDLDQNGDAFGAGESTVWFNGMLPGGFTLTNPVNLSRGPGGAFYMIDNNTLDTANPEAVYRLFDFTGDDDVNDAGEVTHYFQLSPAGVSAATTFDIEFDNAGAGYVVDITDPNQIESIDRINPAATARAEWLNSVTLLNLTGNLVFSGMYELEHDPVTDELIIGAVDLPGNTWLIAIRDRNGNNIIDQPTEIRRIWGEGANNADGVSSGAARDYVRAPDGSIVFVDAFVDQIVRLIDRNGDGDFFDLNETNVIYTAATAAAAGQTAAMQLLTLDVVAAPEKKACPADLDGDGAVGSTDLAILLGSWGGSEPDLDGDMTVGSADLAILLGSWGDCAG